MTTRDDRLQDRLTRLLAQARGWEAMDGSSENLNARAADAFESAAKLDPSPDLARALLVWASPPLPLSALADEETRSISPALARSFARACLVHLDVEQLRSARRHVARGLIGSGSFELGEAFILKATRLGPLPDSDELWREMLFESVHDYGRDEARSMAGLLGQIAPPPADFLEQISTEGSAQILLGCLEALPDLALAPSLPLIIDRYGDEEGFDCPAPALALSAFDEAVAMGMDPTSCAPALFKTPALAAKAEAAILARDAETPRPRLARSAL